MKYNALFPILIAGLLAGCAQDPHRIEASRVANGALYFHNDPVVEGAVVDQLAALNVAADQLVRRSRVNGAVIGAVLGCGLTALSASNARNCVAGAAVGGLGGAVLGDAAGRRDVARRVELVPANDIARDLNAATTQFENIKTALPDRLAEQEAVLNRLTMQLIEGEISQEVHDAGVAQIAEERAGLADALAMSAHDARRAAANLQTAQDRGQDGLDWHIETAQDLANDVESTRSTFSLL